jgi:hypothetical protein
MNTVIISDIGSYLPVAWRAQRSGDSVSVYIHNQRYKTCYDGLLQKLTIQQLKSATKSADSVIIDGDIPKAIKDLLFKKLTQVSLKVGRKEQNNFLMDNNLGFEIKGQMGFIQSGSDFEIVSGQGEYYAALTLDDNKGFGVWQKITIPPYPYSVPRLRQQYAEGIEIEGEIWDYPFLWMLDVKQDGKKFVCAGTDGVIGYVTAWGKTLTEASGRLYHNIGKIKVKGSLQYRTDFLKQFKEGNNV